LMISGVPNEKNFYCNNCQPHSTDDLWMFYAGKSN
jgi:hypothetical protein